MAGRVQHPQGRVSHGYFVAVDQLPDGAWYCVDENGMVTWAITEKVEGQLCPDGKTEPVQKMAAEEAEEGHDEATEATEEGEHGEGQ